MNKIMIDSENYVIDQDGIYYLKIVHDNYFIHVLERVKAKLIVVNFSLKVNIDYKVEPFAELVINSLGRNINDKITINLLDSSKVIYNNSIVNQTNSYSYLVVNQDGDNTSSVINNNGINLSNGDLFFQIDGRILANLYCVSCIQNSKIINYHGGNSKVIPNLLIDSNDIVASHSAYIGQIDQELKFYMASRGLKEEVIFKLIYQAILLGSMDLTIEKSEFNKIINEWW